jgi:uncharacterized cupredoxin-like copper-binding protein
MPSQILSKAGSARRAYRFGFSGLALFGLVLTACGSASTSSTPTTTAPTATVAAPASPTSAVTLKEWSVGVSPTQVKAGKYTYTITNAGQTAHELLVFKSDLAPSAYPMKGTDINEEGAGMTKISDGDNIEPGGTQQRTIDLSQPGTYLFVCNIPGHFMQGMSTVVAVT